MPLTRDRRFMRKRCEVPPYLYNYSNALARKEGMIEVTFEEAEQIIKGTFNVPEAQNQMTKAPTTITEEEDPGAVPDMAELTAAEQELAPSTIKLEPGDPEVEVLGRRKLEKFTKEELQDRLKDVFGTEVSDELLKRDLVDLVIEKQQAVREKSE
jgi:hypothetical protein